MVHRMDSPVSEKSQSQSQSQSQSPSKRPKLHHSNQEDCNPLEEPSPLGLKLKKTPSFLDFIHMNLSHHKTASLSKTQNPSSPNHDKLKASNFPASLLNIGTWQYKSRYEGDLVAKCYFAKHKLVWEVLDGGLKNKIEIQWSDIMAIKANYPENGFETLDVVLARQPLFFREINPQPRKHTLWQATSDFTSGQATVYRRHFLEFPQGTLAKHFEKLMQCDPRLRFLNQQPEIVLDTPYFPPMVSIFGDQSFHNRSLEWKNEMTPPTFSGFRDTISTSGFSSSDIENQDPVGVPTEHNSHPSTPIPEMLRMEGWKFNETQTLGFLNKVKVPGIRASMSVGDLINHIGECISEQMKSDNPDICINETQKRDILDEITHYLLSDSQSSPDSDDKFLMSRVNSLCCLLQKEATGVEKLGVKPENVENELNMCSDACKTGESNVPRTDSVGELLLHLPRIASLPQFLGDKIRD